MRLLEHPFVTGLGDGSLDKAAFRRYVLQDTLYLSAYKDALASLAERTPHPTEKLILKKHILAGVEAERELRAGFAVTLGLSPADISEARPCGALKAYTDFLNENSRSKPFGVGLAAMLPCYRSYADIARRISPRGCPDPLYQRWIELYTGPEYAETVAEICALVDQAAKNKPDSIPLMEQAVEGGLLLEHDFFECVWKGE